MSRLGRLPITIPQGVTVTVESKTVSVAGQLGTLQVPIAPNITVLVKDGIITVLREGEAKQTRAFHGLTQRLIQNAVIGVSEGFVKRLDIKGVGMRAVAEGEKITFSLGFSHPVLFTPPQGAKVALEKNTVVVSGADKQLVGQVAAQIRQLRPVEPYKGKGIRYQNEHVVLKPGKAGKGAGAKGA